MRGTGTRTEAPRCSSLACGAPEGILGDGEAADGGSRVGAQLGFVGGAAAARKLGFGVKRVAQQEAAAFIGSGEGASACGPAEQGGAAREPESARVRLGPWH
jgi:hypothetical protein